MRTWRGMRWQDSNSDFEGGRFQWQECDSCSLEYPVSMMHWISDGDMCICDRCYERLLEYQKYRKDTQLFA